MDALDHLVDSALSVSTPDVMWLDQPARPAAGEPLSGEVHADLLVVGAGYTGLWAALQAAYDDPGREIVVIDAGRVGEQASGRNGGFLSATVTHGLENGLARFPAQIDRLVEVGRRNLGEMLETIESEGIDARVEMTGNLIVANAPWLVDDLAEFVDTLRAHGERADLLGGAATRARLDSPTYCGGALVHTGEGLVDPARLAWGLADACRARGVRIFERSAMTHLERRGAGMCATTTNGSVRSGAVVLGTGAYPSPLSKLNRRVVPVYDYVLATEPLTATQLRSIGWSGREGVADTPNQFHYYRLSADDRIVWGGYDAVFHNWGRLDPSLDQRPATHRRLARHFFETFPQLEDVRFSHRWGGVIDTSTRFSVGFGTAFDGRVAYAVGYTGLGVGATRFGARVCLDLLYRPDSELLGLELVRRGLMPFPPEPVRTAGIQYTRRALARADANQGRRGPWLRLLDRLGLGFDS